MIVPRIDSSWTLLLDRDGVLNRKLENGYVLNPAMLEILPGAPQAVALLAARFGRIVIVTNQRGIARGLMNAADLDAIHFALIRAIGNEGGRIDSIFVCPHDLSERCVCRKPGVGLAMQAKERFPEIDFARSVLVGDSDSDIEMGRKLGMVTVRIQQELGKVAGDRGCASLMEFARSI